MVQGMGWSYINGEDGGVLLGWKRSGVYTLLPRERHEHELDCSRVELHYHMACDCRLS